MPPPFVDCTSRQPQSPLMPVATDDHGESVTAASGEPHATTLALNSAYSDATIFFM